MLHVFRSQRACACFVLLGTLGACASEALPDRAATTSEDLSLKTDALLCSAINALSKVPPFSSINPKCSIGSTDMLHYEGGFVSTGGLGDLNKLPPLTNTMIQCAIAHSDQGRADGLASTPVGQFGVSSSFVVNGQGVTPTQYVEAERIGSFYLFGAAAPLDVESIRFESAQEMRSAGTMQAAHVFTNEAYTQNVDARTGVYLRAQSENANWGLSGSVTIPVGPIEVMLTPSVSHSAFYEGMNNNLVSPVSSLNNQFDFNTQLAAQLNCVAGCQNATSGLCVCQADPSASELAEHERQCAGGTCDYSLLDDGVLPFDGALAGATQSSLYDVPMLNWFHFGPPAVGGSTVSATLANSTSVTEPIYDLNGSSDQQNANSTFGLGIGAGYSLGPFGLSLKLQNDVNLKSAFAVRQRFENPLDHGENAQIETWLDAQSGVKIELDLTLTLPIVGDISTHFDIYDAATPSAPKQLASVSYTPAEDSGALSFTVQGQPVDPSATIGACLQSPAPGNAVVAPADPGNFLTEVAKNSVKAVHPCDAKLCDQGTSLTTCSWDDSAGNLACTTTVTSCDTCAREQNYVAMCNGDQPLLDEHGQQVTLWAMHGSDCIR